MWWTANRYRNVIGVGRPTLRSSGRIPHYRAAPPLTFCALAGWAFT